MRSWWCCPAFVLNSLVPDLRNGQISAYTSSSRFGPECHWIAPWQLCDVTRNNFIDLWSDVTCCTIRKVKDLTFLLYPTTAVTGVDSGLQECLIPPIDEITMETIACCISLREHERLSSARIPSTVPIIDDESHFVKQRDKPDRKVRRTISIRELVRVSHVRFVVSRIKVFAIPTRGEDNLSTKTLWTILGR